MPLSIARLMQMAAMGGFALVGSASVMRTMTHKKFQQSEVYSKAINVLEDHEQLKQLIGSPIQYKTVDLTDTSKNFTDDTIAKFEVPIRGSNTTGTLFISADRQKLSEEEYTKWNLEKLELELSLKPGYKTIIYPSKSSPS